jgi:hypothetical protein
VASTVFRLVCVPGALNSAPAGWARDLLTAGGEVAVLVDDDGLPAINAVARALDATSISVVRNEPSRELQEQTVIAHAGDLALVWVAPSFSAEAEAWATARPPMTLLVAADGPLSDEERARIERFVRILGGQAA